VIARRVSGVGDFRRSGQPFGLLPSGAARAEADGAPTFSVRRRAPPASHSNPPPEIMMRNHKTHRYDDGPTACRPSSAVLKSIQQAIKKSKAMSTADVRLAAYMGLVAAPTVERPTGFNDGVFYPPTGLALDRAPGNRPLRAARM
jgi:hypothetical protein